MKISLAWVFDHINADKNQIDVQTLVTKFNQITAEIEGVRTVAVDLDSLACGQVSKITPQAVTLSIPEWGQEVTLPGRTDVQDNAWLLVRKKDKAITWATTIDLGGEKEMIVPALMLAPELQKGAWKKEFESHDTIITVDNKSITHRPDMWGHRGFAREIAATFDLPLIPFEQFLIEKRVIAHDVKAADATLSPFTLSRDDQRGCKRFAGLYVPSVSYSPSLLWMVSRLSRVDNRSINAIVDMTNYVMLDTSQPMHAFDADRLPNKAIVVRTAKNKEQLVLLDGQAIELTEHDIVVADGIRPLALAGIMGGKDTAVTANTNALFLESANFDAATIRRTAQRYKVRSEASARFEKNLDPNQNTQALARFLKLLADSKIQYKAADSILSLGKLEQPPVIEVSHAFIEARLGVSVSSAFIVRTLEKLAFTVHKDVQDNKESYRITVPLFRATKDIAVKEDIVEEVGRFYGYSTIPLTAPMIPMRPTNMHGPTQISRMKHLLAYGLSMRELYGYSFFDEAFLRAINWDPRQTAQVKNPVSENWYRLATTLMPSLFRAVRDNGADHDQLRFFEWARVWDKQENTIMEKKVLTGIFFDKRKSFSFYEGKALLQQLFDMLHMPVHYKRANAGLYPWLDLDQSAYVMHDGRSIGVFGRVQEQFWHKIIEGSAFVFELDGNFLEQYHSPLKPATALPKYPPIERDVSMMVPLGITVEEVTMIIQRIDPWVVSVTLRDFFQKKEWKDQKSLTMRYVLRDPNKTLTKEDADRVQSAVTKALENVGATIR